MDIPQVVALYSRALPDGGSPSAAYYEEVFFNNPWADESLPSLVCEREDGRITAFLGVVPRRFSFKRQTIQGAIATQLMVDPSYRSAMIGVQLLKTLMAGPQDLLLADLTNRSGRAVWSLLQADTVWLYSLRWNRLLRPLSTRRVRSVLARLGKLPRFGPAAELACSAVDACQERIRGTHLAPTVPRCVAERISETDIATRITDMVRGASLRPQYDIASLKWILGRAAAKRGFGNLQQVGIRDQAGDLVGWCLYYAKPHGRNRVLQIAAREYRMNDVLDSLFYHAWNHGAISVFGRLEPHLANALASRPGVGYYWDENWLMVHARNAEVLSLVHRGDAFLTELDGERLIGCVGEESV